MIILNEKLFARPNSRQRKEQREAKLREKEARKAAENKARYEENLRSHGLVAMKDGADRGVLNLVPQDKIPNYNSSNQTKPSAKQKKSFRNNPTYSTTPGSVFHPTNNKGKKIELQKTGPGSEVNTLSSGVNANDFNVLTNPANKNRVYQSTQPSRMTRFKRGVLDNYYNARENIGNTYQTVKGKVGNAYQTTKGKVGSIFQTTKEKVSNVGNKVGSIFTGLGNKVTGAFKKGNNSQSVTTPSPPVMPQQTTINPGGDSIMRKRTNPNLHLQYGPYSPEYYNNLQNLSHDTWYTKTYKNVGNRGRDVMFPAGLPTRPGSLNHDEYLKTWLDHAYGEQKPFTGGTVTPFQSPKQQNSVNLGESVMKKKYNAPTIEVKKQEAPNTNQQSEISADSIKPDSTNPGGNPPVAETPKPAAETPTNTGTGSGESVVKAGESSGGVGSGASEFLEKHGKALKGVGIGLAAAGGLYLLNKMANNKNRNEE